MADTEKSAQHVKPYVHECPCTKALHFSVGEMQSRMRIDDPDALDLEYTRTMMGFLLFNAEPLDIAMIGLGGGSLAKFCYRHLRRTRIQVAEINPHVMSLRDEFQVPQDDQRFTVLQMDGAHFVRWSATAFDVLMVDGFDSDGLPSRLSSQRFYDDCCAMLRPQGILVVNLHAGHARFEVFVDRIRRSFDDAVFVVQGADRSNSIVFAGKGRIFEARRPGVVRRPRGLDAVAAAPLLPAFADVVSALEVLRRPGAVDRAA